MREDITSKMTPEGLRRYNEHIELFGETPKIKTILDANFYGLMSPEEVARRILESEKNKKKVDKIIGAICFPIFLGWLAFSLAVCSDNPNLYFILHGPVVGVAGTIYSALTLCNGLKKNTSVNKD